VLWVFIPFYLVRQAERGSAMARLLFALMLAFLTAINAFGLMRWMEIPEEQRDWGLFAVSAVLTAGYATGTSFVWFSPRD
jgi:hypothetical protein